MLGKVSQPSRIEMVEVSPESLNHPNQQRQRDLLVRRIDRDGTF